MMLTIHGLPNHVKYHDLKALVKQECNIGDFILDNLIGESETKKKVRIGLANEREGAYLIRRLDGFRMAGHVLRVVPVGITTGKAAQNNYNQGNGHPQRMDYQSGPNYNHPDIAISGPLANSNPMHGRSDPTVHSDSVLGLPGAIHSLSGRMQGRVGPIQNPSVPVQGQAGQWDQGGTDWGRSSHLPQGQTPQATNYNYQITPQVNAAHGQPAKPHADQLYAGRLPQQGAEHGYGYTPKNIPLSGQGVRRVEERAHVLRSLELVNEPPAPARQPAPAPMTLDKEHFQGPELTRGRQAAHQPTTPWQPANLLACTQITQEKQPFQQMTPAFDREGYNRKYPDPAPDKRPKLDLPMDYDKGPRFSPRREVLLPTHRRAQSPGHRSRRQESPSPPPPPARYESPRREKRDPDQHPYHQRAKDVRPAYDAPPQAANQAIYSGGYRPSLSENVCYPIPGRAQGSSWQDRDRLVFRAKKEEDRRDSSPKFDHPELDSRSPRASRSPARRPLERSPPRERYRKHSTSPRSPRRSWALEKRRSPDEAPPPPVWPGQAPGDDYRRHFMGDDKKQMRVWERPPYEKSNRDRRELPEKRFGEDVHVRSDVERPGLSRPAIRDSPPCGRPDERFSQREPVFEPRRDPKFEKREPHFEPREPKFEQRSPTLGQREPHFEPRESAREISAKFEQREPKFGQRERDERTGFGTRGPKFEPRKTKFDQIGSKFERGPKYEPAQLKFQQRELKYESRFEPSTSKFESRRDNAFETRASKFEGPNFETRDPKFDPREPKFEPRREPKFEPRDPKFEPRDPKFESMETREPTFEPRYLSEPKSKETRPPRFEPSKEFGERRDFRRELEAIAKRYEKTEREPFADAKASRDSRCDSGRHVHARREDYPLGEKERKLPLPKSTDLNKEFDEVYKKSLEFKQKVEELRRGGDKKREDFEDSRRFQREEDGRREGREDTRHARPEERRPEARREATKRAREPAWAAARPHWTADMKAKREKAIEEVSQKMMHKYGTHFSPDQTTRVLEELKKTLIKIFQEMFQESDVSFIEMVVKFNARFDAKAEAKIFDDIMNVFPSHYRKRQAQGTSEHEAPVKTPRLSTEHDIKRDNMTNRGREAQVPGWGVASDHHQQQQQHPVSVMMQQLDIVPQMTLHPAMGMVPALPAMPGVPAMVPRAFLTNTVPNVHEVAATTFKENDDGYFNLFLCKDDFEPYSSTQADYLKKFLVNQIIAASESSSGWTPDFTLKGLQSLYRYELVARDEATRDWIMNLDFSSFSFFNVLVYTKEELWYERAAVWLPGHSRAQGVPPLTKLKLQNKQLEGVNIGKWKLVKAIVTAKGTRLYVDMPPSSARALETHKMMLSYELQKVSVFLKAVAVDKDAFDMGLKEASVEDGGAIAAAIQHSPMPAIGPSDPNVVKVALKGNKALSVAQARKVKEKVIDRIFKYHQGDGTRRTDFVKFGFCLPGYLAVLPENRDSKSWLEHLNLGKLYKHAIVVLGADDSSTKYIRMNVTVKRDGDGCNSLLIMERLKLSNQGVKGLNFSLWKLVRMSATRDHRRLSLEIDMDVESIATLSSLRYKLDYIDGNNGQHTAVAKYEGSYSKLEDLVRQYRAELSDSYDVANMDLESDDADDIIYMGQVN